MAKISIDTTPEEQNAILHAIKKNEGKAISVAKLGEEAGINPNRARYVVVDLLEANKIERTVVKAFNKYYKRYKYRIIE